MNYKTKTLPKLYQNLQNLEQLKPLADLKPLSMIRASKKEYPSPIELIFLCTNLIHQSHLIINNEAKRTGMLTAEQCTSKATRLMDIIEYPNKYPTYKQIKEIRKDFKLNGLYK